MNFTKVQGAGNDFILVEAGKLKHGWSQMAQAMCHRRFGVGGDGLLLLLPSDVANFRMCMLNPDGSEAEACGNGLRCLARYVIDMGLADAKAQELSIETIAGIRKVRLYREKDRTVIHVGMGEPKFRARDIPVMIEPEKESFLDIILDYPVVVEGKELALSLVSMGNPHAVYFWQNSVDDFPLSQLGPKVEYHKLFPNGVNFEVARVISRQRIEASVSPAPRSHTLASMRCRLITLTTSKFTRLGKSL